MRKVTLAFVALVALVLSSCSKGPDVEVSFCRAAAAIGVGAANTGEDCGRDVKKFTTSVLKRPPTSNVDLLLVREAQHVCEAHKRGERKSLDGWVNECRQRLAKELSPSDKDKLHEVVKAIRKSIK